MRGTIFVKKDEGLGEGSWQGHVESHFSPVSHPAPQDEGGKKLREGGERRERGSRIPPRAGLRKREGKDEKKKKKKGRRSNKAQARDRFAAA